MMNDRADSSWRENDYTTRNMLAEVGTDLERNNSRGGERELLAIQHGRAGVAGKANRDMESTTESEGLAGKSAERAENLSGKAVGRGAVDLGGIPEVVRSSVASKTGVYDARRLRSQREIIRDVMLSAADCETWLTLGELRALTRYGEASISAQLRHLRKGENGGYEVVKRHREGASPERPGTDGRGECVWEYRMTRGTDVDLARAKERLEAVGA
jgi:hypothetical protein